MFLDHRKLGFNSLWVWDGWRRWWGSKHWFRRQLREHLRPGGDADSNSNEESPEAANAEDFDEDDSSIHTFTTACLNAANANGGSGNTKIKTKNLNSYAIVKIKNSDGTKDDGAQGTGPASPTTPAGSSMPGALLKKTPQRSSLRTFRPVELIVPEKKVWRERQVSLCVCVKFSRNCVWFVRKHWEDLSFVVLNFLMKQTKIIYIIGL